MAGWPVYMGCNDMCFARDNNVASIRAYRHLFMFYVKKTQNLLNYVVGAVSLQLWVPRLRESPHSVQHSSLSA